MNPLWADQVSREDYRLSRGLALAIIRVVVGGWFLKAAFLKLTLEPLWWVSYPAVTQRFISF